VARVAVGGGHCASQSSWFCRPVAEVAQALQSTELPLLGINTRRGNVAAGEAGLAAVPGRAAEAQQYIGEAVEYGAALGCHAVHVMAGVADGEKARATFVENLSFAASVAAQQSMNVLIEPINTRDIPGYFLNEVEQAAALVAEVDCDNVKIMFDCYHVQIMQGDLLTRMQQHLEVIGHIQFAAVPDRGEPGQGEIDYQAVFRAIDAMGWTGFLGAEYRPRTTTDAGLTWMQPV